jgi:hypothetical protein
VSGRGTVHTYTVVHRAFHPWFVERVPYVVALVDLDEGPRLMTNIVAEPETVAIGTRVDVTFERHGDITLPLFKISNHEE